MRSLSCLLYAGLLTVGVVYSAESGVIRAGRIMPEERDGRLTISAGSVRQLEVLVEETTRAFYDVTDQEWKQERAQEFDESDFNLDDGYATVGLKYEKAGRYFSWQAEASLMNPDTEAVARRNYYIAVGDDIEYNGQTYDHMKIPEGESFTAELLGGTFELRGQLTPFTFKPGEAFSITPWVELGIFSFAGQYKIDAGEARGVTQYQNPPEDFVIGGSSKGITGIGLPEWGGGGEVRIGTDDSLCLSLRGSYTICEYNGGTRILTSSSHREKSIDLDHDNLRLQAHLELPTVSGRAWLLGVRYQKVESAALIESQAETDEEIIARRERFDKEVEFNFESIEFLAGFTF